VISHEKYMKRCLELAMQGMSNVAPNPMVGCVIVYDGKIIGEGYHKQYGSAHAEVNAINSVIDKSLLSKAILYVNLEPCSHSGKTPPCTDLLIQHKIKEVVISNTDPNPLVSGNGIKKLTDAGIKISQGILEREGNSLNKRFFTFHQKKRPYIILKWAKSKDGFIGKQREKIWISDIISKTLVHKWRAEEQAILIGHNTAINDNPSLNVRHWKGKNPIRIILDKNNSLPRNLTIFNGQQETIIFNEIKAERESSIEYIKTRFSENLLDDIMHQLYKRNILSVIIEGGGKTLKQFIDNGVWDEARVFTSEKNMSTGIPAPVINSKCIRSEKSGSDILEIFYNL
jgi:diaminohydroxyphosphoribosylaminopyrimidine deaminase / 5-amino-6-(5-phosphoribosylamino)uracil reductase